MTLIMQILKNVRFYILFLGTLLAFDVYAGITLSIPPGSLQIARLTETYAFLALLFLFFSLLPTPLYTAFPSLPYKGKVVQARRAIGVLTLLFALCHAYFAFFKELGGFAGLGFLNTSYLIAISLSFTALLILLAMASTSFDFMVRKLGKWWKRLHQLVYLAGILILIHALLLGTQFGDPANSFIAQLAFLLVAILLVLEGVRIDKYLLVNVPTFPKLSLATVIVVSLISFLPSYLIPSGNGSGTSFNIHAQHLQVAQQVQQGNSLLGTSLSANQLNSPPFSGLQGDPSRRFTLSFEHPDMVATGQDTPLSFRIYNAGSGNPQKLYTKSYGQYAHLVIVDEQLEYFTHIHPQLTADPQGNQFMEKFNFPHPGLYHLYLTYQPYGSIEQQQAFTLQVGNGVRAEAVQSPESKLTKTVGGYTATLITTTPLKAAELSVANQTIILHITKDGQAVKDLWPNLFDGHQGFGQLTLINEKTYEFFHVYPNESVLPPPDSRGGPDISFLPFGLYSPIQPGTYRVFAQFSPENQPLTADFTVLIK